MKTNKEIYNKVKLLPNFSINNSYHIGSEHNTSDFYMFAKALDEPDLLNVLGIDIPNSELLTCVKEESQLDLIIEKEKFGWLLEVYFPHILGEIKNKKGEISGYEFSNKYSHSSIIYNEDYTEALAEAIRISEEWLEKDLAKVK
jgi:hypothetical protein